MCIFFVLSVLKEFECNEKYILYSGMTKFDKLKFFIIFFTNSRRDLRKVPSADLATNRVAIPNQNSPKRHLEKSTWSENRNRSSPAQQNESLWHLKTKFRPKESRKRFWSSFEPFQTEQKRRKSFRRTIPFYERFFKLKSINYTIF